MATSRREFFKSTFSFASAGLFASSLLQPSKASAAMTPERGGFAVADNGQPLAIIVTPDNSSRVVQYAVQELQSHVQHAYGAKLDVVPEKEADASSIKKHIYIGQGIASKKAGISVDDLAQIVSASKQQQMRYS